MMEVVKAAELFQLMEAIQLYTHNRGIPRMVDDILVCWCTFHHWEKLPEVMTYEKERFLLAQAFRVFSPCPLGPVVWASGRMVRHGGGHMVEEACLPRVI